MEVNDVSTSSTTRAACSSPSYVRDLLFEGALAANNLGVAYAAERDLSKAISMFREALVGIRATRLASEDIESSSLSSLHEQVSIATCRIEEAKARSETSISSGEVHSSAYLSLEAHTARAITGAVVSSSSPTSGLSLPILSQPFVIPAPCCQEPSDASQSMNGETPPHFYLCSHQDADNVMLCVIIVFNLAASTHMMLIRTQEQEHNENALPSSSPQETLRKRALLLYEMCSNLVWSACQEIEQGLCQDNCTGGRQPCRVRDMGFAWMDVVLMATLNNQAQLYSQSAGGAQELAFSHNTLALDFASSILSNHRQKYAEATLARLVGRMADFVVASYVTAYSWKNCSAAA